MWPVGYGGRTPRFWAALAQPRSGCNLRRARAEAPDGNGNVTYLEDVNQNLAASYVYDPYGNALSSSGTMAAANTYRFSSKECMVNSGLYYYGFRFYSPSLQRWVNRDPIGEAGDLNLYRQANNRPTDLVDALGMACCNSVSYNPSTQCCENGNVVAEVTIWICTRPVGAWWGATGPGHKDVCCNGPYRKCYGHSNNHLKRGQPIPPQNPTPDVSHCKPKLVCPRTKKLHCDDPVSPCNADSLIWNCRDWAGWEGGPVPDTDINIQYPNPL